MNVGLLLPAGLIALVALAIPLLLHLVRQTEQKRIEFAALRWLVARAQPRRRPRFNEWLLLLLRLLLLAMLAFWLAQPVLSGRPDLRPWAVVDPAIDATQLASRLPEDTSTDVQLHWLAPGFPPLDTPAPDATASTSTSISSLLRELDATLPKEVSLIAVVADQFDATDAQRPRLGRRIMWLPVPSTSALAAITPPRPMRIAAYVDPQHRVALPYVRAAVTAWGSQAKSPAPTQAPLPTIREIGGLDALKADDTHLLWFASAEVPARQQQWVRSGGVMLIAQDNAAASLDWNGAQVAWRNADGRPLALRMFDGKGVWVRMLIPFKPQSLPALLQPEFPRDLQSVLAAEPPVATRAWADSYAPVFAGPTVDVAPSARPLDNLLSLLIAMLFGVERWLAMSMRRFRTA